MRLSYPAHGWLPVGAHLEIKWDDQGKDLATNWQGPVQAPGNGECIGVLSDRPFPNGFGPSYPVVRIDTGAFGGHEFYLGHTTAAVGPGERFAFGQVLSHANQGHNWAGTTGGWVELGEAFGGSPGPKRSSHWFDGLLATPLTVTVPDPPLHWRSVGWRVVMLTANLHACGWYAKRWHGYFDPPVHKAVVDFKRFHHLPLPKGDAGVVDAHTSVAIQHAAAYCKKHKTKEGPL